VRISFRDSLIKILTGQCTADCSDCHQYSQAANYEVVSPKLRSIFRKITRKVKLKSTKKSLRNFVEVRRIRLQAVV
jgi:Zn-finger protein